MGKEDKKGTKRAAKQAKAKKDARAAASKSKGGEQGIVVTFAPERRLHLAASSSASDIREALKISETDLAAAREAIESTE